MGGFSRTERGGRVEDLTMGPTSTESDQDYRDTLVCFWSCLSLLHQPVHSPSPASLAACPKYPLQRLTMSHCTSLLPSPGQVIHRTHTLGPGQSGSESQIRRSRAIAACLVFTALLLTLSLPQFSRAWQSTIPSPKRFLHRLYYMIHPN